MTKRSVTQARRIQLVALGLAGLLVGYLAVSLWPSSSAGDRRSPAAPSGVLEDDTGTGGALPPLPPDPRRPGSSFSVVGGMSPEEVARLGVRTEEDVSGTMMRPDTGAGPPDGAPPAVAGRAASPPREGPPIALQFSPDVREAARRYRCPCGCSHTLDVCPCNDQPIGAGTMLTYVQKLLERGLEGEDLDAGMVDRYGERVLAGP